MSSKLSIIIQTLKKGDGEKKAEQGLSKIKKTAAGLAVTFGTVAAAAATLKRAYDFSRAGAELEFVRDKFDRLARSVGSTSDVMLTDLRAATRGLYSDTELAASATDFLSLGLAKTHDEVVRLAAVSSALNMDMNQLVLTLTNKTTMRFDSLGVAVDGFAERVAALEASGMSAEDAFGEAFLQQAEAQIERVGHAADSSIGAFMRLEAAGQNLADETKRNFSEAFSGATNDLANLVETYNEYQRLLGESSGAQNTYLRSLARARYGIADTEHILMALREEFKRVDAATESWDASLYNFNYTLTDSERAVGSFGAALNMTETEVSNLLDNGLKLTESTASYNAKLADLTAQLKRAQDQGYAPTSKKIQGLTSEIETLEAAHKRQTDQFILGILQQMGASAEMQLQYALDAGLIDKSAAKEVLAYQAVGQALEEGTLKYEDQAAAISYIVSHLDNLDGKTAEAYATIYINRIYSNGSIPRGASGGFEGNQLKAEDLGAFLGAGLADGGPLGGADVTVVGEQGYELVFKKDGRYVVVPHEASKQLLRLGLVADAGMYLGGILESEGDYGGGLGGGPSVSGGSYSAPLPVRRSGGNRSGGRVTSGAAQAAGAPVSASDVQAITEATAVDVASATAVETAAQTSQAVSRVLTITTSQQLRAQSIQAQGTDEINANLRTLIDEQRAFKRELTRALQAAVQQVAP